MLLQRLTKKVDDGFAALRLSIAEAAGLLRSAADDPDNLEGDLRIHLREAARLIDKLSEGYMQSVGFNRRASRRFAVLSILFLLMAALNVATWWLR